MTDKNLKQLTDKIFYLPFDDRTDRPMLAAVAGAERTLLVDAGNSSAHAALFKEKLADQMIAQPEFVALTHWHWDHIFGLQEMKLPAIAHQKTKEEIERMIDYEWTDEALERRVEAGEEIEFCAEMIKKSFRISIRKAG